MKITNVYCDACGKLMTEYHTIEDLDHGDMQFCPECWPTIVETVRHLAAGMMAEEPDDPTAAFHPEDRPEEEIPEGADEESQEEAVVEDPGEIPETELAEETPEAPKKKPDKGKAQALRDAGWSVKDIAAEIGVSDWWIYQNTEGRKKKAKKPLEWG